MFILLWLLLPFFSLHACTGIQLIAKDGSVVHGRTLEFGMTVPISIIVIPRGYSFQGTTPSGPGLSFKGKYALVGASATFNPTAILDGMNEKGLSVGTFYFPTFASYTPLDSTNQSRSLSPEDFPNWILTQFATLNEVKQGLSQVVIVPTISKNWGNQPPPFHYIVYDSMGKSLVIEPMDGKLIIRENPLGVFTNSPNFDWHMTNLRNYINLKIEDPKPVQIGGITLAPLGQGAGLLGLPGDFTPPSRFVRAALYSFSALPSDTAEQTVFQVFHILNQFDIPIGVDRQKVGSVLQTDYTQATCVRNPRALRYYYKTYDDQTIRFVDLRQFNWNGTSIQKINTTGFQKAVDMSSFVK